MKPYPLSLKILQILKEFRYAGVEGLVGAVTTHYSIHTVRKALKEIEDKQLIYSVRDDNKRKVYSLTEKGKEYLKEININFNGLEEAKYNNICLEWSNFMGGKTIMNDLPKGIDALNVNEREFTALVIENETESLNDLLFKLENITRGEINFKKIYVVTFTTHRENDIPKKQGETEIEIFKR